jgi:hypothetical protein
MKALLSISRVSNTHQRWKGVPRHERHEETKPREEEYTSITIKWIQDRYRFGFVIDGVNLRGSKEVPESAAAHRAGSIEWMI